MQAGPDKCDDQQNKKTPIIFPEAGDEYLQQHDSAQEGNVAEVVQVGIGKIDCQDQAQPDGHPLQGLHGIHRALVAAGVGAKIAAAARPSAHASGE